MKKVYVDHEELWNGVQQEFEKAKARNDVMGMNWCNAFLQMINNSKHIKVEEVEENEDDLKNECD